MTRANAIKAVGFDLDGTLIDSLQVKGRVFAEVVHEKFGLDKEEVIDCFFHSAGGRKTVFNDVTERFFGRKITDEEFNCLHGAYSARIRNFFHEFSLCDGALDVLEYLYGKAILFSSTGIEEKEAIETVEHLGIKKYFSAVIGWPKTKAEAIQLIAAKHSLKSGEILFVGDSLGDVWGAKQAGCKLIAVAADKERRQTLSREGAKTIIKDLSELLPLIEV